MRKADHEEEPLLPTSEKIAGKTDAIAHVSSPYRERKEKNWMDAGGTLMAGVSYIATSAALILLNKHVSLAVMICSTACPSDAHTALVLHRH